MTNKPNDPKGKPEKRKVVPPVPFVPYGTMFKFEGRPRPLMALDIKPRNLQCVNCGDILEWRIYTIAPEKFDIVCPVCHMTAREFWKGKLHKEIDPDG